MALNTFLGKVLRLPGCQTRQSGAWASVRFPASPGSGEKSVRKLGLTLRFSRLGFRVQGFGFWV